MKLKLKYNRSFKDLLSDLVGYGIDRKFDIIMNGNKIITGTSNQKLSKQFTLTDLSNGKILAAQENQIKNGDRFDMTFIAKDKDSENSLFKFNSTSNPNCFHLLKQDDLKRYQIISDSKLNASVRLGNKEIATIKSNRGLLDGIGIAEITVTDETEDPMTMSFLAISWQHLLELEEAPSLLMD